MPLNLAFFRCASETEALRRVTGWTTIAESFLQNVREYHPGVYLPGRPELIGRASDCGLCYAASIRLDAGYYDTQNVFRAAAMDAAYIRRLGGYVAGNSRSRARVAAYLAALYLEANFPGAGPRPCRPEPPYPGLWR